MGVTVKFLGGNREKLGAVWQKGRSRREKGRRESREVQNGPRARRLNVVIVSRGEG